MKILKIQILITLILISANCLGSEDRPKLTLINIPSPYPRYRSGEFRINGKPSTIHEIAIKYNLRLDAFKSGTYDPNYTLVIDGTTVYNITVDEYQIIKHAQDLQYISKLVDRLYKPKDHKDIRDAIKDIHSKHSYDENIEKQLISYCYFLDGMKSDQIRLSSAYSNQRKKCIIQ